MAEYVLGNMKVRPRLMDGGTFYEVTYHRGGTVVVPLAKLKRMIQDEREAEERRAREDALLCPELEALGFTIAPPPAIITP